MALTDGGNRHGSGGALVVAALILGASVVVGSVLIRNSLDSGTAELAGVRSALGDLQEAVKSAGAAPTQPAAQAGRPDPTKRYTVKTEGAPAKGPQTAKIEIVEFSDFQ